MLLIGWSNFSDHKKQYWDLGKWRIISIEFPYSFVRYHFVGKPVVESRNIGFFHYNLGQKVLRILHFLMHSRCTLQICHHGDPSPTPPWLMLFSQEQKCSGHTTTLFFFGGEGEISWVNWVLEGRMRKWDIQGAFFLTFLSKIVAKAPTITVYLLLLGNVCSQWALPFHQQCTESPPFHFALFWFLLLTFEDQHCSSQDL